jgi:CBS domain-containing protein
VAELVAQIARGDPAVARRQGTLIVDEAGRLAGIVTRGDLIRAQQNEVTRDESVLVAGTPDVLVAFPEETLQDAMRKMLSRGVGRLPVVARDDPRKVVGYLGRADMLAARQRQHEEEERRERGPLLA